MSVGGSSPTNTWLKAFTAMGAMNEFGMMPSLFPPTPVPILHQPSMRSLEADRDRLIRRIQEADRDDTPPIRQSMGTRLKAGMQALLVRIGLKKAQEEDIPADVIGARDSISSGSATTAGLDSIV